MGFGPMSSYKFWYKRGCSPSGPGAFKGLKDLMARRISDSLRGAAKDIFISWEMVLELHMGVK